MRKEKSVQDNQKTFVKLIRKTTVVAYPDLGTINHTLLTIGTVRDRGLKVVGFVFSGPDFVRLPDSAIPHNPKLITDFCGVPSLGPLPRQHKNSHNELNALDFLAQTQASLGPEFILALVRERPAYQRPGDVARAGHGGWDGDDALYPPVL
ncbi:hypothetical protein DFAR_3630010 [Desulfarculales bacterium]